MSFNFFSIKETLSIGSWEIYQNNPLNGYNGLGYDYEEVSIDVLDYKGYLVELIKDAADSLGFSTSQGQEKREREIIQTLKDLRESIKEQLDFEYKEIIPKLRDGSLKIWTSKERMKDVRLMLRHDLKEIEKLLNQNENEKGA
ncbi:hypothetical protein DCO58_11835 [Helicobacter saguini]|uniref:Uncharacterized protein n=1 Tax=Helicobacter saguini TaxID=1548018 RepID=A0A347VQA1_9HELI|nr:hypothetical protein [Helicobacter saguini]MWV61021.1 hypothetical protein [Helicobacter saguini]MWV68310.1 hypothetical protein [Helicobacter saguini]MWV70225.1 hypothetical protein [Helicobacter saguini]MWV72128.1 hypothetical protein [Helicobacter saguini]TLD91631.1 hypothetical protein LS64_011605 [Helicobacter saguini]